MSVSATQSGKLGLFVPGGRVDCVAARQWEQSVQMEQPGTKISWGYCVEECGGLSYWNSTENVVLKKFSQTERGFERSNYIEKIQSPTAILGRIACNSWLKTLR